MKHSDYPVQDSNNSNNNFFSGEQFEKSMNVWKTIKY